MSQPSAEVAADFKDALQDLKINSRPEISNLTLIAKENTEYAQAISRELENHIRTTRPEWKLPALYVLDSIVKNVGTPYTVYLGRNLYRTFMDAYTLMDPATRKAMEGLLKTWKQPVPESMDMRPVFSPEVTRDIENALIKFRTIAVQQQALSQKPGIQHNMPARPMPSVPWRNTPTPPQNATRFAAANDPRLRQPLPPALPYGQYPPSATPQIQSQPSISFYPQPPQAIDVEGLKASLSKLITSTQAAWALSPVDVAIQQKLKALLDLQMILNTQTLPPEQLKAAADQIQAMSPPPAPATAFTPPASIPPPVIASPQQNTSPLFPPSSTAVNIGQILANARPPVPPSPAPAATTPSLADMLRRVSSPMNSSSTPASVAPFYPPPFSAAPLPMAIPVPTAQSPALAPASATTVNLAQLLGQFSKSAATPMAPVPQPHSSFPQSQPQSSAAPLSTGDVKWLLNALKAQNLLPPGPPMSAQATPLSSEPMTRQVSANTGVHTDVDLTTASMKQPRFHLITKLYEAYPNICATCGRRFESSLEGKERKARHMDWHFKVKDPDVAKRGIHRSWYISEKEWIEYREVDEASPEQAVNGVTSATAAPKKETKDRYVPVPTDAALVHAPCPICQEKFEPQWLVEANDFVWMDAVKVNGKVYHATCWEEYSKGSSLAAPSTPDSVLGKRKAEDSIGSGKKVRAY